MGLKIDPFSLEVAVIFPRGVILPLDAPRILYSEVNEWIHRHLDFPFKNRAHFSCEGSYGLFATFKVKNLQEKFRLPPGEDNMMTVNTTSPLQISDDGYILVSELVRAVFRIVGTFVVHEFMEGFKFEGETVADPHAQLGDVIQRSIFDAIEAGSKMIDLEMNRQTLPREPR